jgi:hypothetical protein
MHAELRKQRRLLIRTAQTGTRARSGDSDVISIAIQQTSPEVGRSSPASRLISVDFPAPFGPITAWISPADIDRHVGNGMQAAKALLQVRRHAAQRHA